MIPRQHGGRDDLSNLALACNHCNLRKGTNLTGIDPESGQIVPVFNPRKEVRFEHFELRGLIVFGLTPTGRATARVLGINTLDRLDLRADLQGHDELP
jgi:HNH endonuclease